MDIFFSRVLKTKLFLDSKIIRIQKRPNFWIPKTPASKNIPVLGG